MQGSFKHVVSATGWLGALTMALLLGACSTDTTGGNNGGACSGFDEDCRSCRTDGDCCKFSINCAPGSICNDPADPLFVSDSEVGICIKVICDSNADCDAPKTCNREKICEAPVCQNASDCGAGKCCRAGMCSAECDQGPLASSCEVLSQGSAIKQGDTVTLNAVAKNANGAALSNVGFDWTSDNTGAAAVAGNVATGGATSGTANVTAKVSGRADLTCTGQTTLKNFADVAGGTARVVFFSDKGEPISGATVYLTDSATTSTGMTDADGSVTFAGVNGAVAQATAIKAGWQYVSVVQPGTNDILLNATKKVDITKAGGFRGSVDISATKRADIKIGIAGPSLPANVLDLQLESLIGDFIDTRIDAPDLGLNDEVVGLPGGIMFALGSQTFTDDSDSGNLRCQGDAPGATEIGCYVSRGPDGPSAAWVLAGQLKLSAISPIAGQLSGALGGGGDDLPIGDILTAVLPLLRNLNHGINAGINITSFAKVNAPNQTGNCTDENLADYEDKCIGDFSKYQAIDLAASAELAILSAVQVPTLPRLPDGSFSQAAIILGGAQVPGRGLVPLGLSAGLDVENDEPADGKVFGAEEPFGANSDPLDDGFVPLAMATPHSGIEGSQLLLVAIALDPDSIAGSGGIQLSTIINRVDRVGDQSSISGTFLTFPTGTFDVGAGSFTPADTVSGAGMMRMLLERDGQEWLVYAPHGSAAVSLPNVAAARSQVLGNGIEVLLQVVNTSATYAELFTFGSGKTIDKLVDITQSFVIQACSTDAAAPCKIQ